MESSFSSFVVFFCVFCVSVWCLSRRLFNFFMYVIFVVMVTVIMISICNYYFLVKRKEKKKMASSIALHVGCLFFVYLCCFSRCWSDFIVYLVFVLTVIPAIISICSDLLGIIAKGMAISPSFVDDFGGLLWVFLWCVPRCWYDFTMYTLFVGMFTSKMILLCIHLLFRGKKEERRVERETMRGRGLLSNRIDEDQLVPGDHIYSWRHSWIYAHHGIYGRDGKVIHLTRGGGQKFGTGIALDPSPSHSKDNPMNPCPTCGCQLNRGGARVISSCMECFLSGGKLYLFHYGVSVPFFQAKLRGGTCTLASSDPPEMVLDRAESLLSKDCNTKIRNVLPDYDLMENNCEDFAIFCKTGPRVYFYCCPNACFKTGICITMHVRRSGQVVSFEIVASAVLGSLVLGFPGAILGIGYYLLNRLDNDFGRNVEYSKQVLRERFPSVSEELEAMAKMANECKRPWRGRPELFGI